MPEMGNRLRPLVGGALPPRTALPEDGYDAGVKKPVADPKRWKVPSGKDWVTSKLQELENLVQTERTWCRPADGLRRRSARCTYPARQGDGSAPRRR
jgi:hypothetical protein